MDEAKAKIVHAIENTLNTPSANAGPFFPAGHFSVMAEQNIMHGCCCSFYLIISLSLVVQMDPFLKVTLFNPPLLPDGACRPNDFIRSWRVSYSARLMEMYSYQERVGFNRVG